MEPYRRLRLRLRWVRVPGEANFLDLTAGRRCSSSRGELWWGWRFSKM